MKKIIAFIGLMGVGKTTIGKKLADKLGYYFIDLDQEIEDRKGKTIPEIFADEGEKYFRQLEEEIAKEIVLRDEKMVLSLGGGAFLNENIRKTLKKHAQIIWLDADIDVILYRIGNKNNRPLLNNNDKRAVLKDLAKKRYPIYQEADFKLDTAVDSHDILVNKIISKISKNI